MEWKPIETAPNKGRILVYNPYFGVYSSEYVEELDNYNGFGKPNKDRKIKWSGYPLGVSFGKFGHWYCVPTHWMELPEPPKEEV